MCTIIFILVRPLLGYILYCTHQRLHPFLISVWSIACCCDAVWGKPCQSRGNSDISVARDYSADLIVVIRIQAPAPPRDDLTLFVLLPDSGGCSKLVSSADLLPPPQSAARTSQTSTANILPLHFFILKFSLYPCAHLLNPGSLPFCCQCQSEIMYYSHLQLLWCRSPLRTDVYVCRPVVLSSTIVEKKANLTAICPFFIVNSSYLNMHAHRSPSLRWSVCSHPTWPKSEEWGTEKQLDKQALHSFS